LSRPSAAVIGEAASAVVSFVAVAGLGADNGGYFPTTWGWAAVILCGIATVLLALLGPPRLRRVEKLLLIVVAALVLWTFCSSFWSISVTRSMLEGERSLVYFGSAAVAVLLSRRAGGRAVVIGTWAGITAVSTYALLSRLFPVQFGVFDPLSGNRLSTPVGYSNALGIFAALGLLLALALAARSGLIVKMAASSSAVVLSLVLYFAFARGAWAALLFGLVASIAVDRQRLQLATTTLALAVCPALATWYASRSDALTHINFTVAAAQRDGHSVAAVAVLLMAVAALGALMLDSLSLERRLRVGPRFRYVVVGMLAIGVAAAVAVALVRYGTPSQIAQDAWRSFTRPSSNVTPPTQDLNARLATLAGSGRVDDWRVAAREVAAHPWLGSGAGTFGEYWFQYRSTPLIVHDAHNLYLETLAEIGPLGLALVALLLGALLVATGRSRTPLAGCAFGACVAYTLHAAVDWDWELPCLLVATLLPAFAVVGGPRARQRGLRRRLMLVGVAALTAVFALLTLIGNIELSRSAHLSDGTNWRQAESAARSASDLAPWSAEPLRALAVAQAGLDQIDAARANLRAAVGMEPGDWSLWYQLSEVSAASARRHALSEAKRLNPKRTSGEVVPGDLRLVTVP
jgi:O-antigen ligase